MVSSRAYKTQRWVLSAVPLKLRLLRDLSEILVVSARYQRWELRVYRARFLIRFHKSSGLGFHVGPFLVQSLGLEGVCCARPKSVPSKCAEQTIFSLTLWFATTTPLSCIASFTFVSGLVLKNNAHEVYI